MKCPEFEKLNLYIDGELKSDDISEINHHLKTCSECRLFVDESVASETLLKNKVQQYIVNNSVKTKVLESIKNHQILSISAKPKRNVRFKFAFVSIFSFLLMLALYISFSKPNMSTISYNNSIQSSNLNSFIDGKPFNNSQSFNGKLSEYHHYSGNFVFNVNFKEQISKISWVGSGTLLIAPHGEINIGSGDGKLELLLGKALKTKSHGKSLLYKNNIIILKSKSNNALSNSKKLINEEPSETNNSSHTCVKKIISKDKAASNSVSIFEVPLECSNNNVTGLNNKLNATDFPVSASPTYIENDVSSSVPIIKEMNNPFTTDVIKLTGEEE